MKRSESDAARPVAKKRFGQHFLHDPQVIERLLRAIDPRPGQTLVEIGPGLGALTRHLLERAGRLHVIEIDRELVPHLQRLCGTAPNLVIHAADALRFDFARLSENGTPLRLVGNLPYNISTPLLFHLFEYSSLITDMHFMLQKEVVERIVAAPGEAAYGRLTATVAARAQAVALFAVGSGAFRPPPQVESAVLRLVPRPPPFPLASLAAYDRIVAAAFAQRRKTIANALRGQLAAQAIAAVGLDPQARAEQLAPCDFARLADRYLESATAVPGSP
jgi:16S rRNA (adenine1518-N6/adenine1519-N6)-dimethyltransferase